MAGIEWSQPEPTRQAVCAVNGRARDVVLSKLSGARKIMGESQTSDTELSLLLDSVFASVCPGSSLLK